MRIKIVKCEARNAVNIENIDKFRNEAVGDSKLMEADHDLFRGSLGLCMVHASGNFNGFPLHCLCF
jgi:hypothetical protein